MALLIQIIGWFFLLAAISARYSSFFLSDPFSTSDFDDPLDDFWFPSPTFESFHRTFAKLQQEFERFENETSTVIQMNSKQMTKIKTKLDAVSPVCNTTTTTDPMSTEMNTTSLPYRSTKTTICFKEMIDGSMKYIYREIKITDEQENVLSQQSNYTWFPINIFNENSTSTTTE